MDAAVAAMFRDGRTEPLPRMIGGANNRDDDDDDDDEDYPYAMRHASAATTEAPVVEGASGEISSNMHPVSQAGAAPMRVYVPRDGRNPPSLTWPKMVLCNRFDRPRNLPSGRASATSCKLPEASPEAIVGNQSREWDGHARPDIITIGSSSDDE